MHDDGANATVTDFVCLDESRRPHPAGYRQEPLIACLLEMPGRAEGAEAICGNSSCCALPPHHGVRIPVDLPCKAGAPASYAFDS
jgi:hypothetical protein